MPLGGWRASRSARPPGTVPYRMRCSSAASDVSRHHVDTAVAQHVADQAAGLLVELPILLVAAAAVDRRGVVGELFVAFAGIGCPQFMKALEPVLVQQVARRADDGLLKAPVVFIPCEQVAAALRRGLRGECQGFTDVIVYPDPAWGGRTRAAAFGAVLDIDPAELLGFMLQARQVNQGRLAQAHAGGAGQFVVLSPVHEAILK